MVTLLSSLFIPAATDITALRVSETWRVLFLIPVAIMSLAIILNVLIFKYDSVEFHVDRAEKEKAIELLRIIYPN
jgi:nitrogen fixation-related uncharacterized protein